MKDTTFLQLETYRDKSAGLLEAIKRLRDGEQAPPAYSVDPYEFNNVPGSPFCYSVSSTVRSLFTSLPLTQDNNRRVCEGLNTTDNDRFIRLAWEVASSTIGKDRIWAPLAKGGEYATFYSDLHLLVDWEQDGQRLKNVVREMYGSETKRIYGQPYYFLPGLTYSQRTQKGLSFRCLPQDSIFNVKGPGVFATLNELPLLLALVNSSPYKGLVELQTSFGSYNVGYLQKTPIPIVSVSDGTKLSKLALMCVDLKRDLDTANETSHVFKLPALLQVQGETLANRIGSWQARVAEAHQQLESHQREIDDIAFALYGIEGEDRRAIEASLKSGTAETASEADASEAGEDESESAGPTTDSRPLVVDLLSYAVGCAFGRWDVCFATAARNFPELPNPFAPLPVYAPGALTPDTNRSDYPLTIDSDGILVDDPDHPDDIVRRVHEVLELLWGERADAIAQEACALLGVKDVRDYLRKGFFDDHIKRYSKSRRKAPIYWLLQSPKKSYGLWLYYHRLDADMLFKSLMQYVEPKLRLEHDRLDGLREQRQQFGTSGKEARQAEKALAQQEALVADVQEFRDRLERAAKHYLTPDLNDGVVLTIAPLWELAPWKEAKTYWNELLAGKYEWSSIGKQLREKGLVK